MVTLGIYPALGYLDPQGEALNAEELAAEQT